MFSREFMKRFPIRKYADITARTGSANTDIWLHNYRENRVARITAYIGVTAVLSLIFLDWHTMDEIIGHATRPFAGTLYESSIPKQVLYTNQPIIEGFEAIEKMNDLRETIGYEK